MTERRTYRGQTVDVDMMRQEQGDAIAMGNASANARGDRIGAGGQVVKTVEELAKDHQRSMSIVTAKAGMKGANPDDTGLNIDKKPTRKQEPIKPTVTKTERIDDNGDIEIDDSEFGAPNAD